MSRSRFELELGEIVAPSHVYTELERMVDRELYQRYLHQWCGSTFAMQGTADKVVAQGTISREDFEAAADRPARPVVTEED